MLPTLRCYACVSEVALAAFHQNVEGKMLPHLGHEGQGKRCSQVRRKTVAVVAVTASQLQQLCRMEGARLHLGSSARTNSECLIPEKLSSVSVCHKSSGPQSSLRTPRSQVPDCDRFYSTS